MKLVLDNGKEIVLNETLANQLQEVIDESSKVEKKQTGWNRVKEGKNYYVISSSYITNSKENNDRIDENLYDKANYFSSKELAEKITFRQTLERKLMRFSAEHEGDKIDLKNSDLTKFYIYYDNDINNLKISSFYTCYDIGIIYFYSKEIAEQAIEEFKDDLIKYFTIDIYHNEKCPFED